MAQFLLGQMESIIILIVEMQYVLVNCCMGLIFLIDSHFLASLCPLTRILVPPTTNSMAPTPFLNFLFLFAFISKINTPIQKLKCAGRGVTRPYGQYYHLILSQCQKTFSLLQISLYLKARSQGYTCLTFICLLTFIFCVFSLC